ncbi:MAG: PAS domain S-box protein, partial [Chloroflexota bacterium]
MQAESDVYQFIVDNVSSMVSRHTLEGVYTYVSPGCQTLLGYEPDELVGHLAYDFFHPEDLAEIAQSHRQTINNHVMRVMYRIRHKLGHYIWFETISRTVVDPETDEPVEIVATSNDITLFKQTEEVLARTASLHQATLESTADGILVVDVNGRIVNSNRKFQEMWRIPPELTKTQDDDKLIAYVLNQLSDPDIFLQKVQHLYSHPAEESLDQLHFKDGRLFERYSQPQYIEQLVVGRVWSFRDITEQYRAQEEARKNAARFQRLINQAKDGIFLVDTQANVLDANEQACRNLGYTHDELTKLSVYDFNVGLDLETYGQMLLALSEGGSIMIERVHKRKDGTTFPVEISVGLLDTGEVLAVARDISARAEAERLLERRLRFERGVAAVSQLLLTGESNALSVAVRQLQQTSRANRVVIYENLMTSEGLLSTQPIKVVSTDGWQPYQMELNFADGLLRWQKLLSKGQPIHGSIDTLLESEQEVLQEMGVLSMLALPIHISDQWYGYICFDDTERKRIWGEMDIDLLQTAANMIGSYLEQQQSAIALRESEVRFRSLANASSEGIVIHDQGHIVEVNNTIAAMLGFEVHELVGHEIVDLVPVEARESAAQNVARESEQPYETLFWHKDGSSLDVEVSGKAIPYKGRMMRVVTARDVTEQKRLEEEARLSLWRRTREVRLTTEITQEIAGVTDLRELYELVVKRVKEQFEYYHVQLLRYDPRQEVVKLVVGFGDVGQQMLAQQHVVPVGVGLIGTAVSTGKSVLEVDVSQSPDWQYNPLLPDTKGELAVLIKLRDEVLGVLDIQTDKENVLDENDRILLEGLCGQVAIAIESTRLRQEMEARLRESIALQRHMVHEGWDVWHADKQNSMAYTYDALEGQIVPLEQQNGQAQHDNAQGTIVKPLSVRGTSIGLLAVEDDPDKPLTPEEELLLESLSEQIAEALDAARL